MKIVKLVSGLVATVFVFGPALLWVGGARPQAIENRQLAAVPDPSHGWDALGEFGPWATDHLPGRASAVRANSWIDYFVLGTLPDSSRSGGDGLSVVAGGGDATNQRAPTVVRGRDGYLYYGPDFDLACSHSGEQFRQGLRTLRGLARDLQRSGRTVRYSVPPNKSSVVRDELPRALPRGSCAAEGLERQERLLSEQRSSRFVPILADLQRRQEASEDAYWKTDTHWTTVGSAIYARALLDSLKSPAADRVMVRPTTQTRTGDLLELAGLTYEETSPGAEVRAGGRVKEVEGSAGFDAGKPVYEPIRWRTTPSTGLVPGRTLFIGDSFTYFGLQSLRPLFSRGDFLWSGRIPQDQMIAEMLRSDTIVLSTVQRSVVGGSLTSREFRKAVRRALAAESVQSATR